MLYHLSVCLVVHRGNFDHGNILFLALTLQFTYLTDKQVGQVLESVHLKVWSHVAWHTGLGIQTDIWLCHVLPSQVSVTG